VFVRTEKAVVQERRADADHIFIAIGSAVIRLELLPKPDHE
jgi:pyruvate/2-oxoglutarate dehydrogenase complex dihydrolipoamide dehydrogenase (E3) component